MPRKRAEKCRARAPTITKIATAGGNSQVCAGHGQRRVAEITANRPDPNGLDLDYRILDLILLQHLKAGEPGRSGRRVLIYIFQLTHQFLRHHSFAPRDRLLIFFNKKKPYRSDSAGPGILYVAPYSDKNIATVRLGASQDERVPPFSEYEH